MSDYTKDFDLNKYYMYVWNKHRKNLNIRA